MANCEHLMDQQQEQSVGSVAGVVDSPGADASFPGDQLTQARRALASGDIGTAKRITGELASHWPESEEVQHLMRLLAPPRVAPEPGEPGQTFGPERAWLRMHATEHRGCWIALKGCQLLASSPRLIDVSEVICSDPQAGDIVVWYEPADPH